MQSGVEQPVVVVGAGIVGISTAIWLRRRGRQVIVIDREGPAAGASRGNGGVLAAAGVVPVPVPGLLRQVPGLIGGPLHLRWRDLPGLAPWLVRYLRSGSTEAGVERVAAALTPLLQDSLAEHQALAEGTGAEGFVVPSDYAYLYRDRAARAADEAAWALRRTHGFAWSEAAGAAFRAAEGVEGEAAWAGAGWSVRLAGQGHVLDPQAYVEALAAHLERSGGAIRRGTVEAVTVEAGKVRGLRVDGAEMPAAEVVLAGGAWSADLLKPLGLDVPLATERGYHVDLWEPDWMPRLPVMITWAKVVMSPMHGRIRLAGLVEYARLDAPPAAAPVGVLKRLARSVLPGVRWSRETDWMGQRPVIADSVPAIGPVPGAGGLWIAFGHGHVGLTGGPATGRLVAGMVTGERANRDASAFAPARFA